MELRKSRRALMTALNVAVMTTVIIAESMAYSVAAAAIG